MSVYDEDDMNQLDLIRGLLNLRHGGCGRKIRFESIIPYMHVIVQ